MAFVSAMAGEFVNLTFNQPDFRRLRTIPSGGVVGPVEDLLRGWEVSVRQPFGQWSRFRDEIQFSLLGGGQIPIALERGMHVDRNDFSVLLNSLHAIGFQPDRVPPDVLLNTTGTVPENALTFDWYEGTALEVSITDGVRTLYTAGNPGQIDVSSFAGNEVTISVFQRSGGMSFFDVIGFGLVPEPEMWALVGVGLVGLFIYFRCKRD